MGQIKEFLFWCATKHKLHSWFQNRLNRLFRQTLQCFFNASDSTVSGSFSAAVDGKGAGQKVEWQREWCRMPMTFQQEQTDLKGPWQEWSFTSQSVFTVSVCGLFSVPPCSISTHTNKMCVLSTATDCCANEAWTQSLSLYPWSVHIQTLF